MCKLHEVKSHKKRLRGKGRKLKVFERKLIEATNRLQENKCSEGYWHLHIPYLQYNIGSYNIPISLKRSVVLLILERLQVLIKNKGSLWNESRVVACITENSIWDSQIVVFFDEEYFNTFFIRNREYQCWIPVASEGSFTTKFSTVIPPELKIKGYTEIIKDEDFTYRDQLWFIGELN